MTLPQELILSEECRKHGIELYFPSPILCTDNGAMIACSAYYKYKKEGEDDLTMDAYPYLEF